ncbi:amidase [Actinospica sp. MGRD01-02]|uniref:Amidase n=1 Tax=Actinospica acidithermotolerans TaxID=2828514 RepID=A0A941EHH0_9ACTN|nr:amidase family protein [Actinospica acidithermotolerans]MBR7829179.1 amidase [Actinospica acidithermotolerans]
MTTTSSAGEIARAVRAGQLRPTDAVRQSLDRIARLEPGIGAFRTVRAESALAEAAQVEARADLAELPLAGVPVAVKDNIEVAGEPMRNGSAATDEAPSARDHPVTARLRAAGAVVVGLTNVPELCLPPTTDSVYGIARNPWDRGRTPGGSSGGSAAAVAAGMVPFAHGNDGLGSIRIPAACCGLVGIKPGTGVVPVSIDGTPVWGGLSENGPLAATVQDTALALSVMAANPALATLGDPGRLRIGFSLRQAQAGLPIDPQFVTAAKAIAAAFAEIGHPVTPHTTPYPLWLGNGAVRSWFSFAAETSGPLERARLDRRTRQMAAIGRTLNSLRLDGAGSRARWRDGAAEQFFGDAVDVLLLPALSQPPAAAHRWGQRGALPNTVTSLKVASLFAPWNIAGWPAMNVPAGVDDRGLPIGVQLVARPGHEHTLLNLAAQLEAVRPWPLRAPGF